MQLIKIFLRLYIDLSDMKYLLRSLFLFILLVPAVLFSQQGSENLLGEDENLLKWSATRKLTWDDYKANPVSESDAAASTTTLLSIEYNITSSNFSYKIKSRFSKNRSWGLHKTNYILRHEQGHFDIAEVFARKLHKKMGEYKFNKKTFQKDLKKIYDEVTEEKGKIQNLYDEETNHSINKKKQAEWLKMIEVKLEESAKWATY